MDKIVSIFFILFVTSIFLYSSEVESTCKNNSNYFFFNEEVFNNFEFSHESILDGMINYGSNLYYNGIKKYSYYNSNILNVTLLAGGISLTLLAVSAFIVAGIFTYITYYKYNGTGLDGNDIFYENVRNWVDSTPMSSFLAGMIACWIIGGVLLIGSIAVWIVYGAVTNGGTAKIRLDNKNNDVFALAFKI